MSQSTKPSKERIYYYDNARGLASIMGVFYHIGMIFSFPWIINIPSNEFIPSIQMFINHVNIARMPLFLFISGYFTMYSIRKNSVTLFLQKRVQRILMPLVISYIIIGSIQTVLYDLYNSIDLEFIAFISRLNPFRSNFHFTHLWFLYHLVIFSVILVLMNRLSGNIKEKINSLFVKMHSNIFSSIIIWSVIVYFFSTGSKTIWSFLANSNSDILDIPKMAYNFPFFCFGAFALLNQPIINKNIITAKPKELIITLSIYLVSIFLLTFDLHYLAWVVTQIETVSLLILILNICKLWLSHTNKVLKYISNASYAFYIFHHPIVLLVGIVYLTTHISTSFLLVDYFILCIIAISLTYTAYHFFVYKSKIGDLLFTGNHNRNLFEWLKIPKILRPVQVRITDTIKGKNFKRNK